MKKYQVKWNRETNIQTFYVDDVEVSEKEFFEEMRKEVL